MGNASPESRSPESESGVREIQFGVVNSRIFCFSMMMFVIFFTYLIIIKADVVENSISSNVLFFGRKDSTYNTFQIELRKSFRNVFDDPEMIPNNESFVVISHGMEEESGIKAQEYVFDHAYELPIQSFIMISGFLQRKYRPAVVSCSKLASLKPKRTLKFPLGVLDSNAHDCSSFSNWSVVYPVPALTIGAELDGVVRVTRIAEAYENQKKALSSSRRYCFEAVRRGSGSCCCGMRYAVCGHAVAVALWSLPSVQCSSSPLQLT